MPNWHDVTIVLLGRWPAQVNAWGPEAIEAYVGELEADGLSPDAAITALRSHPGEWPPAAGVVAEMARRDPSTPTFEEAVVLAEHALKAPGLSVMRREQLENGSTFIGEDEARRMREDCINAALNDCHPLVGRFVETVGRKRLAHLLGRAKDEQWGEKQMRELREMWERCKTADGDRKAALRLEGGPRRLDPLAGLQAPALALAAGDNPKGDQK